MLSSLIQVFIRKVIELHDKYFSYVNECFGNHTLFHKVRFEFSFYGLGPLAVLLPLPSKAHTILSSPGTERGF